MAHIADEHQVHRLIGGIYDCALDTGRLPEIGRNIEQALGVGSSIHFVSESRSGRMLRLLSASKNFDDDARSDYRRYYHERNVWFQRAVPRFHRTARSGAHLVLRGEELIPDVEFSRTEFCADWCSRVGIHHMTGCVYPLPGGMIGGSGVHKTRRQGAFTDEEKRLYALYMTHFARAIETGIRMGIEACHGAINPDLVAALNVGVILVCGDRRIVQANPVAEHVLATRRWLTSAEGRLRTVHYGSLGKFAWHVAAAAQTGGGGGTHSGSVMRLRASDDGAVLPILIAPFSAQTGLWGLLQPTAAIILRDLSASHSPAETAIAKVYGLSAAESRLAALLASGLTLTESAERAGISRNTAKTQLKSAFAKTGFSRQSQLISDLRSNPLLVLGPH